MIQMVKNNWSFNKLDLMNDGTNIVNLLKIRYRRFYQKMDILELKIVQKESQTMLLKMDFN